MFKKIGSHLKKHSGLYSVAIILAVLGVSIYTAEAIDPTRYVTQSGAGSRDGTSWANALGEAEFAALTRTPGTTGEFWVAQGVYRPSVENNSGQSFELQYQMKIYGGFKGNETLLSQRNPLKYKTVLTGDLGDDDNNKIDGVTESAGDIAGTNSVTVLKVTGGSAANTILDGVTITAGNNAGGTSGDGGGIYVENGSPLIKNCTFAGNRSAARGAGIAATNWDTGPVIDSCTFYGNTTLGNGGGIYSNSAPAESTATSITNCTFVNNRAVNGGAAYLSASGVDMINCTAKDNTASSAGGALYILNGSAEVKNSIFWENIAPDGHEIKLGTGTSAAVSYCVVEDGFSGGTNIITADPFLGELDYNGGNTKTCLIGAEDSARNAGTSAGAPVSDQRGVARPDGAGIDIGSVEYSETVTSVMVTPSELEIEVGSSGYVLGKTLPAESYGELTWSSSDTSVATVSGGFVNGLKAGTAVITATSVSGGYTDSCEVTVVKKTPVIYGDPMPSYISYGQTLADSTLSGGSADVPGTFAWQDPSVAPSVTDSNLTEYNVIFTPTDTVTYRTVVIKLTIIVYQAVPTVTELPSASDLVYGHTLANSGLTGGAANVPGSFAWSDSSTMPLATSGGTPSTYPIVFTPADTVNYTAATAEVPVYVAKANSVIAEIPVTSAITYGQTLANSTLTGGSGSVPGTFSWSDPTIAPAVPDSGLTAYSITFTPSDSANYNGCFGNATLIVNKADPTVTASPSASAITYGNTLSDSTLSGGSGSVPGSFEWTHPDTVPAVSDSMLTEYPVTFIPTDFTNYNTAHTETILRVDRAETQYSSEGYEGNYDTAGHTVSVTVVTPATGALVKYGTVEGIYDLDTPPEFTDAGYRTVYFEITSPNHTTERGSDTVNILKADTEITALPAASDITYGQTLASSELIEGAATVPGTFSWSDPSVIPTVADSGVTYYNITFTPDDASNYNNTSGSVRLTVNRASTEYEAEGFEGPYDRSSHGITVSVSAPVSGSTVMYGTEEGVYNLGASPEYLAAGTNRVYFRITSPNHTTVESYADVIITKAVPQITSVPTGSAVTYGQTLADSILSGGSASVPGTFEWTDPSVQPAVSDSDTTPFAVTFFPDDSSNYSEKELTAMLGVNRAATQYDVTEYTGVYDGTSHGISVSVTAPAEGYSLMYGTVPGEYIYETSPSFSEAGSHVVYFHITSPNHTEIMSSGTVSINKAAPVILSIPSASGITYGQTLADSALTGGAANIPGTFEWTNPSVVPAVSDSETTEYGITFIPEDSENYSTASTAASLSVDKADLIYEAPDYTGTYDVSSHGITVTVTSPESGALVEYGTEAGNYPFSISPVFSGAGEHTVYFRITAVNFNAVEGSAKVIISKASPSVLAAPSATSIVYGQSLADSILINGIGSVGGSFGWADPAITPTVADSETTSYEVIFTPDDTANYESVSITSTLTVTGAAIDYVSDGYSGTYDGNGHSITVSVNTPESGSTLKYGTEEGIYDLDTPPVYTDTGTYVTYFEISAENYISEYGSQQIDITKAIPVISEDPSSTALTYGQTLAESVLEGGSASTRGTFSWTSPETVPSVSDSETTEYSITFTPEDEDNYESASSSVTVVVSRAQTVYSTEEYQGPYDRDPHSSSVTVTTPASGALVHYGTVPDIYDTETPPSFINAGEYTVYFRITSPNYTEETGMLNVTISKAATEITELPTASALTYGGTLNDSFLSGGTGSVAGGFAWENGSIVPSVSDSETTEYGVIFTPYDTANYETETGYITIRIEKASVEYSAEGYEGVYDGAGHGITVTVTRPEGAVVTYGTVPDVYDLTETPLFTEVGSHTVYYKIEDPNFNNVTGSATVVINPMDEPVEVTEDTKTDSENSGVLTVGKNTVEDFAIYDSMVDLGEQLAENIDPEAADAVPAVSADVTTSVEIFTPEEIREAINSTWGISPDSRDIALTVSVTNTVGTDAAYKEEDGNLLAKVYRFIISLFTARTGEDVGENDYLPLEVKMTIPAANIEKLPDAIKDGLSENNFLERISLFAVVHGEDGAVATDLCDITGTSDISSYITVTQNGDGDYTVRSRYLVFNMPGSVPEEVAGAPYVQLIGITGESGLREGSYYLVQDGIRDGFYDICTAMAVKTLKGKLNVTIAGDLEPASADWTLTGAVHPDPTVYTGTRELLIEQDVWDVNIPEKEHYDLSVTGEQTRDLRWGEDWEISAEYLKIRVTGLSTDIVPEETKELRLNKDNLRTLQLHAEVVPSDAFERNVTWSSSDSDKVSVDQTGLVTALELTPTTVYITAESVDGGYTASQPVRVTNITTSVSIPDTAEVRVGGDTVTLTAEVEPADATDPSVIWSSSDTSKATISENGTITAISAGTVTITAEAADGDGSPECTDTCALTVLPRIVHVSEVTVEPATLTLNAGYASSLRAVVTPEDATDKTVSWSSSNEAVVSVSATGRVTAIAAGTATIRATSTDGAKTGTCEVTVNNIPQPVIPVLPSDTPEAVRREVKPAEAEFTEDPSLVIRRVAPGTITADDLTTDPVTGLVEVRKELAIDLFNGKDIYKEITSEDITELPIFAADVEAGKTAAVAFKVKGSELFAATPDKVMVMKILSSTESEFFTYAGTSAEFADKKFTIQTASDPIYTGAIEGSAEYYLVLFVKDGGGFDLDKAANGEVVDPAVIVKAAEKDPPTPPVPPTPEPDDGGGGCRTSLPVQALLIMVPLMFAGRRKKREDQ